MALRLAAARVGAAARATGVGAQAALGATAVPGPAARAVVAASEGRALAVEPPVLGRVALAARDAAVAARVG